MRLSTHQPEFQQPGRRAACRDVKGTGGEFRLYATTEDQLYCTRKLRKCRLSFSTRRLSDSRVALAGAPASRPAKHASTGLYVRASAGNQEYEDVLKIVQPSS